MNEKNPPSATDIKRHQIWWQLAVLAVVSTLAVYVGSAFDEQLQNYMPEAKTLASIFNKKPSGLSGLAELVKKVGLTSHPWLLPYRNLRSARGMLVIVAPSASPAEFEAEQILKWVEAGNDLVYLDHFSFKMTRRILEQLHLNINDTADFHDIAVPVDISKPEFAHVPSLVLTADTMVKGGDPVVSYQEKTIFSLLKHGKGRILIGTAPNICVNRRLSEPGNWANFQFLVNWMSTATGEILFDERCHGFSDSGNVFVVLGRNATGAVFVQLMLLLAVAVYSASKRFGEPKTPPDLRKISNLEFINGLSNAYRRAKANGAILEITGQALRNRLCKLLSISPHEPTEKIIEAWKLRQQANPNSALNTINVVGFLEQFDKALQQKQVSDHELKKLMISCDKISSQLTQAFAAPSKRG